VATSAIIGGGAGLCSLATSLCVPIPVCLGSSSSQWWLCPSFLQSIQQIAWLMSSKIESREY
jgi:hypothetical protein